MNDQDFQKSLKKERDKHRTILEGCVDAVVTINQYGIVDFFNKAAEDLFEYKRDEVLNKNVNMLMPFEHSQYHDQYLQRFVETQVPRVIGNGREVEILTKSGNKVPILLTLSKAVVDGKFIFTAFIKDYTEKKRIEAELRKLSLVARKTNNGVLITDKNRTIEWANEGFEKISGYAAAELIGKKPGALLQGEESDPDVIKRMQAKLNAKETIVEEILNYNKNGKPYWVRLHIDPVTDEFGNVEKFVAIEHDITEERKMLKEIQLANEQVKAWNMHYKTILDAIPDIMFRFDIHGTYLDYHAKEESEKDLVAKPEELLGRNIFDVLPEKNASLLLSFIEKAIETGKNQIFEDQLMMTHGVQYYECRLAPVKEKNDVIAIIRNITVQKKAQLETIESETRLNETQQIARLGSWEIDLVEDRIYWSKETYKLFGITKKNTPPQREDFLRIVHPADRRSLQIALDRIINQGIENSVEIRNILPDGSIIHILARGVPLFKDNKIVKVIGTLFDITERKKFEEDLKNAKEKAEESTRAKELFLANTSHEIRTPMNAIVGITELLKKTPLNQQQHEYLSIIEKSAGNLLGIINDILDISKIESNKLNLEKTPFIIKDVIISVVSTSMIKANEKNINLNYSCPSRDQGMVLVGDSLRLGQILLNLVNNAVKFTNQGEVNIILSLVEETPTKCKIKFEIKDTGIGIEKEKLESIFNEFNQADTSTTRLYGGTGLGLSISRKLIELMGGTLQVESAPGIGTNFHFVLSFEKDAAQNIPVEKTKKIEEREFEGLSGLKILLVEDQEFNQFVAKRMLELMETTVDIAANGKLAIEKISENDYDVVLMDIQMPVMDGIEATSFIREHMDEPKSKIPIIALTAHALKNDDKKYMNMGMDGYLSKPFKSDDLSSIILKTILKQKTTFEEKNIQDADTNEQFLFSLSLFKSMAGSDAEFYQSLITTFIRSAHKGFDEINTHIQSANYLGIQQSAHTIKPSFKMIERFDIFDQLEEIETMAKNETDMSSILLKTHKIEKAFKAIQIEMEAQIKNLTEN